MRRINLIPEEAKKITPRKWLKTRLLKSRTLRIISLVVIALILINLWQSTSLLRHRFAIASGKKKINELRTKVLRSRNVYDQTRQQKEGTEKEIKRIEEKFRLLQRVRAERTAWAVVLAHLSELVPENLWINKTTLNKKLISIIGTTFDNEVVSRFMELLDESDYFENTSFNYTQKKKLTDKAVINFEVTTNVVLEKLMR